MNTIQATYPLLLTRIEPGMESHHYQHWDSRFDVWKATYTQGDSIKHDTLSDLSKVAARRRVDETGVGWRDDGSPWILSDHQLQFCRKGHKPETLCATEGWKVSVSASQRYVWTVVSTDAATAVKQFDSTTGEWQSIPWLAGCYEMVSMASDPQTDRLLFFHESLNAPNRLLSWTPSSGELTPVPWPVQGTPFEPALSPDGRKLAFVLEDNEVYTHEFCSGKTTQISNLKEESDESFPDNRTHLSPSWSPDGKRIFYTLYSEFLDQQTVDEWAALMVATPDGQQRRCLLWCDEYIYAVQASRS